MSLFSSFDMYFFKSISICFLVLTFLILSGTFFSSALSVNFNKLYSGVASVVSSFVPFQVNQGMLPLLVGLFFMMVVLNLFSVNSFSFPTGSQMSVVLFLGFSIWLSFTIFSIMKNYLGTLAHLIPEGAPIYMATILMVIEFVSLIIRPLTLSVRMMANILAGHLLMILLSSLVFKVQLGSILYLGLNLVEIFVAIIQSYIFVVMLTLYYSDSK